MINIDYWVRDGQDLAQLACGRPMTSIGGLISTIGWATIDFMEISASLALSLHLLCCHHDPDPWASNMQDWTALAVPTLGERRSHKARRHSRVSSGFVVRMFEIKPSIFDQRQPLFTMHYCWSSCTTIDLSTLLLWQSTQLYNYTIILGPLLVQQPEPQ